MDFDDYGPTAVEQAAQVVSATLRELTSGRLTGDSAVEILRPDVDLFVLLWEERITTGDIAGAFAALNNFVGKVGGLLGATALLAAGALRTIEATSDVAGDTVLDSMVDLLQGGSGNSRAWASRQD